MPAPAIITLGCRLNTADSEAIRQALPTDGADGLVVINTCAVTAEAVRQAGQEIRKARRRQPQARIVVTGCAAQIDPQGFAHMPQVDRVLGNIEKLEPASYRFDTGLDDPVRVNDIMSVRETAGHMVKAFDRHARAFVEVQTGCDHRCTFCIIPFARGNARSVPAGLVVERIRTLVEAGVNEVVLTGVDITSYGADLPGRPGLGTLVQRILKLVPELPRLRLSSLDPVEVDEALMEAVATAPRLMPHLHLSLQAGDDLILKRMKRRHSREDAVRLCARLRALRPDIVLGADLIAGFPTETQAMFENSLALVEECGLTYLHVFAFSSRQGTPAARMPQIDPAVRKARAARLRAAGDARLAAHLASLAGRDIDVLVENDGRSGHSPCFAPVQLEAPARPGSIVRARVVGAGRRHVVARSETSLPPPPTLRSLAP